MSAHQDRPWIAEFEQLWMEVLGVESVSEHDDFFELGGHSLSALRLSTLIREELRLRVLLGHVLENPRYGDLLAIARGVPAELAETVAVDL